MNIHVQAAEIARIATGRNAVVMGIEIDAYSRAVAY